MPLLSNVKAAGGAGSAVGVLAANGNVDEGLAIETSVGVQVAPVGFAILSVQAVVVT